MRIILCLIAVASLLGQCLACSEGSMQTIVPRDSGQIVVYG